MPKALSIEEGSEVGMPPGKEADARRFYGQVLGLRETMKPPGEKGVWFTLGDKTFKVIARPDHKVGELTVRARFRIDKAEAMRQALDKARFRHHDAPHVPGTRGFYAHDPFGNRVELRERPETIS